MAVGKLANRLATVLHYLNRGYTVNVKDLAEEFSISERQIQDDIKLFSTIYDVDNLGHQNYRMKKGYKLIGTENEDVEIAMALMKSLQQCAMPQMNDDVNKALPESKKYGNIFLFNIDYEELSDMKEFHKLLQSIHYQQSCTFFYVKKDGSSKEVNVHPYRIANFSNFWYLLAYDVEAEKIKSYHINSISKVILAGENYISDAALEKEIEETFDQFNSPWFDGDSKSVLLEATGDAKHYLDRSLPKNINITSKTEMDTQMQFHYYDDTEVLTFVKKWLPDIQILDNTQLDQKLQKILKKYLRN